LGVPPKKAFFGLFRGFLKRAKNGLKREVKKSSLRGYRF